MHLGVKRNQDFKGGKEIMPPEAGGSEAGSACGLSCISQPVLAGALEVFLVQTSTDTHFYTLWSTLVDCRNTGCLVDGPYLFMNVSLFSLYALQLSAGSGKLKGMTEATAVFLRASRHWCLPSPV